MRGLALLGLGVVSLLVLVLLGSMVAGLGRGEGPAADGDPADEARERVKVEVLNAAGLPGLARTATDQLRARGLDVVYFGNASGFGPDTSWVLDRVGSMERAERVAEVLGIERVRTAVDSTLYVDVSVVLGRDWVEREEPADTSARGGS